MPSPEGNRGEPGSTRGRVQGRPFRLETRAGEFPPVASLRGFKPRRRRETEKPVAGREAREGLGLNGPVVTGGRPETGRSSPGQGEAGRKPRGGPKGF